MKTHIAIILTYVLPLMGQIHAEQTTKNMSLVAQDNCGVRGKEPHLVEGQAHAFGNPAGQKIDKSDRTCTFGDKVVYVYDGMDIQADYAIKLSFFSAPGDHKRVLKVLSDTRELATITLTPGRLIHKEIDLPKFAYAYGKMRLIFEKVEGSNALVSTIKVFSSNPKKLKAEKGAKANQVVDYSKFLVPQPIYAPFPKTTAGTDQPVMSLNGKWQFHPEPHKEFPSKQGSGWKPIQVPGHWTMQGFTVKDGTHAGYLREFDLPSDWGGKHIRLRFDSVFSDCIVYINGQEAGKHLGTFTAFELDVTELLRPGKNTLALRVRNDSQADVLGSLNQYANFPMGGILRKVTLFAVPELHLTDMRIATTFDSAFEDAVLKLQFEVSNRSLESATHVHLDVKVPGALEHYRIWVPYLENNQSTVVTAAIPIKKPKKWDNEHPNLYTLECTLNNAGQKIETVNKRFGFRQVEVRGKQMFINGKPIKLAGVCRHEAHPLLGRSLTMEQWKKDAELYMTGNVNFIRTSHYPPAEEFVEICDELGLFVELEAPVCWVGHHANYSWRKNDYRDAKWYPYILQANLETIRFHRNNPSIILWSLANESYWSENFVEVMKHAQAEDRTRPVAFHDQDYGGFNNLGSNAPVANIHYPGPNGDQSVKDYTRPIVFGEYCHLNVYNREELVADPGIRNTWGDCLDHIWNKMYNTQACLGGSIWSGIDDLFLLPDGRAVGYGAWGPIDGWRRPKPEYFYQKKVYSPIRLNTADLPAGNTAVVEVDNRHNFTNVNELKIQWSTGEKKGTTTADIAPRSKGKLSIDTPLNDGDELTLSFYSPKGYLIDQFDIPVGKAKATPSESDLPAAPVKLAENDSHFTLTGKGFTCTVDKTTGMITSVKKGDTTLIHDGAHLVINPLKGGGCFPNHSADTPAHDPLCSGWKASSVKATATANAVTINVAGKYAEADGTFTYTINGNGVFAIGYQFTTLAKVDPRQVGLALNLAPEFTQVSWERQSAFSGFPEEHIGRLKGTAPAFYGEKPNYAISADGKVQRKFIREQPTHPWSQDANELGSADFRSTRTGILFYKMSSPAGDHLIILSDGTQAGRCRIDGDQVRLYCIDIDTGGAELFLGGHLGRFRHPLKEGATVSGKMTLQIQ
ncbi:glycoside hydrolase family 2 [Verrucomicrobiaceae bacterium N1E253]|uniref:beta-galactosidase n=1 Tax=Oceaniferula marina TaxID=2748318 RepID=A0A851GLC3_9BACT|nr:glycoside hydrolase family 2 TIM barrel-domain containing protein [Oceaniferula marina]NWK54954.1 glycoside hydrolase family 2 [Oceaniferula marina]